MTKEEFEALTGKIVGDLEYSYIEELYMHCSDMDKRAFCENYSSIASNPIFDYCYSRYIDLERELSDKDLTSEVVAHDLINKSVELDNEELGFCAISLIGQKAYLSYKLDKDMPLSSSDKKLLKDLLG